MSNLAQTVEQAKAKAAARGLEVRLPEPNELFIDIDSEAQLAEFDDLFNMLLDHVDGMSRSMGPSPSGRPGRYHAVVRLPYPITLLERIALQAALGSDRKREILTWLRYRIGEENPSVFFERPQNAVEEVLPEGDAAWKKKYYGI